MNAVKVHGAGDVFANISFKFGLRGQYGPCAPGIFGIATLSGLDCAATSSGVEVDIVSSSSASQPSVSAEDGYKLEFREEADEVVN